MPTPEFRAKIKKIGINPYVDPPKRITAPFKMRGYIPVTGTLNSKRFKQTLVPIGGGKHRLFINGPMRATANVDVGSWITVTLRVNRQVREVPMPTGLASRLSEDSKARAAWDSLTPSRRKEIKRYLNSAKRPETLARNIEGTMAFLQTKKRTTRPGAGARVRVPVAISR